MRPAPSVSFLFLTFFVTLVAWLCLAVMFLIFLVWSPFAWLALKLGSTSSPVAVPPSLGQEDEDLPLLSRETAISGPR